MTDKPMSLQTSPAGQRVATWPQWMKQIASAPLPPKNPKTS